MAVLFASAVMVLAVDQATKAFVVSSLREGQVISLGCVAIRRVLNGGGPGGFLRKGTALLTLWFAEVAVLLLLVHSGLLFQHVIARAALGAAIGGAAGNLFDRLRRGHIVDFVDFGFWPVFNVADTAIVAGALLAAAFVR